VIAIRCGAGGRGNGDAGLPDADFQCAAGWIGFYWGQTLEELSRSTSIGDSLTGAWLKLFQEVNPN